MTDFILALGFGGDTYAIAKSLALGLDKINSKLKVQTFEGKWLLRNWLDDNAREIIHSHPFRHDSRIFYNDDMFCDKNDYEKTFYWKKYHSAQIKLLVISSCTRELEAGSADLVYDNLDFSKKILPKIPKIILNFSDGNWCDQKAPEYVDLIKAYQESIYHVPRDISTKEKKNQSDYRLSEFIVRMVKSNFDLMIESYLGTFKT